jgi:hypothetical protein
MTRIITIAQFLRETGIYKAQRDEHVRKRISEGMKRNWIKRHATTIYIKDSIVVDKPNKAGK